MGPAFRQTFGRAAFRNFPRSGKTPKRSRPTTDRPATARASQKMIFQDRPRRVGFLLEGFPKKRGGEISSAMLAGNVLEVLISGKKQHKLTWWWLTNLMEKIMFINLIGIILRRGAFGCKKCVVEITTYCCQPLMLQYNLNCFPFR